jgi:hypothetical protein
MKQHKLRVIQNRVLRRVFGPKREEVARGWRRLHNEELHNLYTSPCLIRMIKSRRVRWVGHVARMRGMRYAYKVPVGKPDGKRPLARPRHTWDDNSRMYLREVGWEAVEWINLAQDRD